MKFDVPKFDPYNPHGLFRAQPLEPPSPEERRHGKKMAIFELAKEIYLHDSHHYEVCDTRALAEYALNAARDFYEAAGKWFEGFEEGEES